MPSLKVKIKLVSASKDYKKSLTNQIRRCCKKLARGVDNL
jgi:hypothetical protein